MGILDRFKKSAPRQPGRRRIGPCLGCKREQTIIAHGLCSACYHKNRREVAKANGGDHTARPILPRVSVAKAPGVWDLQRFIDG